MTGSPDLTIASNWRKASHSNTNGSCVEVAQIPVGNVAVRDTTQRRGVTLGVPTGAWQRFTASLKG